MNKRVTLWRKDKIPYGTWYAYENLGHLFPKAAIEINKKSPDKYSLFAINETTEESSTVKTANIIIATRVLPDDDEVNALLRMVGEGQHIFISTFDISQNLLDSLRLKVAYERGLNLMSDSLTVSVRNPVTNDSLSFTYPGLALDNYIEEMDSTITTILGTDKKGRANFVSFNYTGGGAIYIHLAPVAMTNFFLLHKNNKAYYDNVLSYLPRSVEVVKWDDYFRRSEKGSGRNKKSFGALGWIMNQKGLAAALLLLVFLVLLIYLFESRRKQRVIPVIPPVKNASLDFVKTIGRLYYQRRDNKNLAQKMTAHFLDHVRSRYNIRTGVLDEEFEKRLAWKSGYDLAIIKDVLYHIHWVQVEHTVSDEALLTLNTKLEKFYSLHA